MKTNENKGQLNMNRAGLWFIYCIGLAIVALQLRSIVG